MSNLNFKCILLLIQKTIDQKQVAEILMHEGYEVNRNFKFSLREERTPSTSIRKDGYLKDFGGDFSGDIIRLLQEQKGLSFKDAVLYVATQLGISADLDYRAAYNPSQARRVSHPKKAELTQKRSQEIEAEVNFFDKSKELQTFKNPSYRCEALAIAPVWAWMQTSTENIATFKKYATYDLENQTLVIKIYDYSDHLISFKRRRYKQGKWVTAYRTHPNNQCLVNVGNTNADIFYVVEGHHDFLTAVLLGINVFMIPTVSYRCFSKLDLNFLRDKVVYFIADLKVGCTKGIKCMEELEDQIRNITNRTKVVIIKDILDLMGIPFEGDKLDLSEVVELWDRDLSTFQYVLQYIGDINV